MRLHGYSAASLADHLVKYCKANGVTLIVVCHNSSIAERYAPLMTGFAIYTVLSRNKGVNHLNC